ncbi:MAG: cytochrome c [Gammaproteobacteria bacterium]|nr:cytochrome c [Gammaproteobacteria bacterium]MDH3506643.1 cytochrome c [Gammaproteobacteria bacterium]
MKTEIHRLVAVAAVAFTLSACGQGGGGAGVDTDTPEYRAMAYRQALMRVIAFKAGRVRGMADGNIPVDEAEFARSAAELATLAGMIEDGLAAGSDSDSLPGSAALPAIWSDLADVRQRAADLRTAAETVASQARAGGFQAAQVAASENIGPACGGCHRSYRQSDD